MRLRAPICCTRPFDSTRGGRFCCGPIAPSGPIRQNGPIFLTHWPNSRVGFHQGQVGWIVVISPARRVVPLGYRSPASEYSIGAREHKARWCRLHTDDLALSRFAKAGV